MSTLFTQASVNSRIAELEAARLSCEADEDAALRLQARLARLQATVAQTRCVLGSRALHSTDVLQTRSSPKLVSFRRCSGGRGRDRMTLAGSVGTMVKM